MYDYKIVIDIEKYYKSTSYMYIINHFTMNKFNTYLKINTLN